MTTRVTTIRCTAIETTLEPTVVSRSGRPFWPVTMRSNMLPSLHGRRASAVPRDLRGIGAKSVSPGVEDAENFTPVRKTPPRTKTLHHGGRTLHHEGNEERRNDLVVFFSVSSVPLWWSA